MMDRSFVGGLGMGGHPGVIGYPQGMGYPSYPVYGGYPGGFGGGFPGYGAMGYGCCPESSLLGYSGYPSGCGCQPMPNYCC